MRSQLPTRPASPCWRPSILLLALATAILLPARAQDPRSVRLAVPPRLQWNENGGYCGEVSFISAGLYYGQYLSQFDARATVGRHVRQNRSELLLGDNDRRAAKHMHLAVEEWNPTRRPRTPAQFLAWIKGHVGQGHPVVIGVYNNESLLYGSTDPQAGDPTYDHIVPVIGVSSRHPLRDRRAFASDTLLFSDNGLWGTGPTRQDFFRPRFADFPADRAQANAPDGPVYSLPDKVPNYGIAVLGIVDRNRETLPVRVTTSLRSEIPTIKPDSNHRPRGRPLVLKITVSGLQPGVTYNIYRYDALRAVPDADFNARAAQAIQRWQIRIAAGTSYTFKQRISSNDIAVYRAVRAE